MCAAVGELTINLGALRENYRVLDSLSGNTCETACAVKADAYGLGMAKVAPALWNTGAKSFFVAALQEGIDLRVLLPDATIYVLNGFWPQEAAQYKIHRLIPVLNSLDDIAAAQRNGEKTACALHFDTGMNRLGLTKTETQKIIENRALLEGLGIVLVMSHFSSSDEINHPSLARQTKAFAEIRKYFPHVKASLCNSGGIFHAKDAHLDMTRLGLALYGGNPTPETQNPMRPVVQLYVPVLQIHEVKKGETAGYNETYRFHENSNVVVIGAGYADGLFRTLSNRGHFYWKEYALPIRGRVSMDLVICDLENIPAHDYPKPYDMIEIIGKHQNIDDLAKAAGTIPYEIITSLGARYRRSYID